MEVQVPITYSMLYDSTGNKITCQDVVNILGVLDRKVCVSCLLFLLKNMGKLNTFRSFIETFFCKENSSFVEDVIKKYASFINKEKEEKSIIPPYKLLSGQTCLEMLRIAFSVKPKRTLLEKSAVERQIFYAILQTNELLTCEADNINIPEEETNKDAYAMLLSTLPYNDYTNVNVNGLFIVQLLKAKMLFKFCHTDKKFSFLLDEFLKKYNCTCWQEYVISLSKILFIDNSSNFTTIKLKETDNTYAHDKVIFDNVSINIQEHVSLKDNVDYVIFRDRPLICIGKDTYQVISPHFLCERVYNSIRFDLIKLNKALTGDCTYKIKNPFVEYSTYFSERTMFYDVMKKIIGKHHYIVKNGLVLEAESVQSAPDFYIRSGKYVYLFEYKDVLMKKEEKLSCDYNAVKTHIESKLVKKEDGSNSAIKQLVENYLKIYEGNFEGDMGIKPYKSVIYPILVVGDSKFTTQGMADILNFYFRNELLQTGMDKNLIPSLILTDISTLIIYQNDFAEDKLSLKKVCKDYYYFLKKKTPFGKAQPLENIFHRNYSLSNYLEMKVPLKSSKSLLNELMVDLKPFLIED